MPLSDSSLTCLHQHLIHLRQLCTIIGKIKEHAGFITHTSLAELEGRYQVVNLLKLFLQAVLWFYHCGLLPQCEPDDTPLDAKAVPFPQETLRKIYENRLVFFFAFFICSVIIKYKARVTSVRE